MNQNVALLLVTKQVFLAPVIWRNFFDVVRLVQRTSTIPKGIVISILETNPSDSGLLNFQDNLSSFIF